MESTEQAIRNMGGFACAFADSTPLPADTLSLKVVEHGRKVPLTHPYAIENVMHRHKTVGYCLDNGLLFEVVALTPDEEMSYFLTSDARAALASGGVPVASVLDGEDAQVFLSALSSLVERDDFVGACRGTGAVGDLAVQVAARSVSVEDCAGLINLGEALATVREGLGVEGVMFWPCGDFVVQFTVN